MNAYRIHCLRDEFMTMQCSQRHTMCTLVRYFSQWWEKARIARLICSLRGFPCGSVVKNSFANAGDPGDTGSIAGSGRSPGGENSNALQYSCPENPMDRGAWQVIVHAVPESQTQLSY